MRVTRSEMSAASSKHIAIVGAGVDGLTAAALLAHRGFRVSLFEKQSLPGGRAAAMTWDGFTFDLGPTLLFMPDVYRDAFARWGGDFDREVPMLRLRPNYRLNYADGKQLVISSFLSETMRSLEAFAPGSSRGFLRYFADAADAYQRSRRLFVGERIRSFAHFLSPERIAALFSTGAFRRLGAQASRSFGDPRVAGALSFQSMYLGMSPFDAPLLYRLLLFTELGEGIFFPFGGIGALPRALDRAARRNGAQLRYESEIAAIERHGKRVVALRTAGGERIECDALLLNADLPYAYDRLLGEPEHRSLRMRHTPSALLVYVALEERYEDLLHHEFVMPDDLRATCNDIFRRGRIPEDPAIYLCAPSASDPSMAPPGKEALYLLVPAPSLEGVVDWAGEREAIVARALRIVEERRLPGLRSRIRWVRSRTPLEFQNELFLDRGSAFGLSHDLLQIGPMRPDNRHATLENCYFAGASTRPATGLPLVMLGALQSVDRLCEELG